MFSCLPNEALRRCVRDLAPELPDVTVQRIMLLPSRVASRGDLSTGAALPVARRAGLDPDLFAVRLAEQLTRLAAVRQAVVAGRGFINLRLADAALDSVLPALLALPPVGLEPGPMVIEADSMHPDSPEFAVQYAHARCCSVLRAARSMPGLDWNDPDKLARKAGCFIRCGPARALLVRLDHWTRLCESTGRPPERASIPLFLQDLCDHFDHLWKAGRDGATLRLLYPAQPSRSLANLALVLATARVIRSGLGLLGVGVAEEIR